MSIKHFFTSWPGFEHKVPIMKENRQADFISYGLVNEYPYYLLDNYRRSSKHNAIVNGKVTYILGNGWQPEAEATVEQQAQFIRFFDRICGADDLNDLTEKLTLDFEIFNGFALEVTWANNGTIGGLAHVPFEQIRMNKDDDQFQVAEWYTSEMVQRFPTPGEICKYPKFDPNKRLGKQLYYYRVYSAGVKHYPLPEYLGGLAWIEADVQVANFHNNNLRNNFWGGYLINFNNGIPTPEEQADIERQIKRKFSGTDNAGRFVVNFNDEASKAPQLLPLTPSDMDKQFDMLNKAIQQEIFVSHRVTNPQLFGIKTEGQLGGRNEIVESFEIFKNTYINDRTKRIERQINYLASFNELPQIKLIPTEPITERLSEQVLVGIMTPDELREKAGLPPLEQPGPDGQTGSAAQEPTQQMVSNEAIRKLSGREYQNLMRIVRHYIQKKITAEVARTMLASGFGLDAAQIDTLLGLNKKTFVQAIFSHQDEANQDEAEEWTDEHYDALETLVWRFGSDADEYEILASKQLLYFADAEPVAAQLEFAKKMAFAQLSAEDKDLDQKIIDYRKQNRTASIKEMAKEFGVTIKKIMTRVDYLLANKRYPLTDAITEITGEALEEKIAEIRIEEGIPKAEAEKVVALETRYRYAWIKPYNNAFLKTSRRFCQIMQNASDAGKVYTRAEIDSISTMMNYNVWTRRGGWWKTPSGVNSPSCRHTWEQVIVKQKFGAQEPAQFESYTDYGEAIRNNAKRGIELNEKNGNKCAQAEGKIRARQLSQGKPISLSTIKRMHSYLSRAEGYYDDANESSDCGYISYLLWGGKAALGWSRNKLRELGELDENK
jgi:hypothetical protein